MRTRRLVYLSLLAGLLPVFGQNLAQLSGIVRDESGIAVPQASIVAVNEDTGFRRTASTFPDGGYHILSLQPGTYKLTVRKPGFRPVVQFDVRLDIGQAARVDVVLRIASVHESIDVPGETSALDTDNTSASTLVGREWIHSLPLNGRGLLTLLELAPGSVITPAAAGEAGQFSVAGQRPNTNSFTVDGISVNTGVSGGASTAQLSGGSLPSMTAFGSLHSLLALEALDEFRIETSSGAADSALSSGAQVALSSHSGSNAFHGGAFFDFRDRALNAADWFANRQGLSVAPSQLRNFGATAGGPIRRDRTFFFASYEGLQMRESPVWKAAVPSLATRASAPPASASILNAFPVPNGPDLGGGLAAWTATNSRPSSSFDGAGLRIDRSFSPRFTLFGRYSESPSSTETGDFQPVRFDISQHSFTLSAAAIPSAFVFNEFRAGVSTVSGRSVWPPSSSGIPCIAVSVDALAPANACASFFRVLIGGIGNLFAGTESANRQGQLNLADSVSFVKAAHEFQFGASYRRLTPRRSGPSSSATLSAKTLRDYLAGGFDFTLSVAEQAAETIDDVSAFAQDRWRIGRRITLTYGFRWLAAIPPRAPVPIWRMRYTDFAPHAGSAIRLTADGRTMLRTAFGLYYDPDFGVATDGVNGAPYNNWQFRSGPNGSGTLPSFVLLTYGFAPGLHIPKVYQWSASIERELVQGSSLSIGYIGSQGRGLLRREVTAGLDASTRVSVATNDGASSYNALQLHYRRRMARSLQMVASYSWSHSFDNDSADSSVYWLLPGMQSGADRGSSNFDVRHAFTAAFSWEIPNTRAGGPVLRSWSLNGIGRARTGFPIDVLTAETEFGSTYANLFRPDLVVLQPLWIDDANAPGGRRLNLGAFAASTHQGSLGRNSIAGFGMSQLDLALRRTFRFTETSSLDVRLEAFNALNHANFADPVRFLSNPLFGQSISMLNLALGTGSPGAGLAPALQTGGPRTLQLLMRFRF